MYGSRAQGALNVAEIEFLWILYQSLGDKVIGKKVPSFVNLRSPNNFIKAPFSPNAPIDFCKTENYDLWTFMAQDQPKPNRSK